MKKNIIAFVLSALMIMSSFISTVAFAAEETKAPTTPDVTQIVNEIVKYESPYYGYSARDFDFTNDGSIDVFDLVMLRKKLIAGDPEVTVATAVKLESYLLGKSWATLEITEYPTTYFSITSEHNNDILKNLTSHDFRFVHAEETIMADSKDPDNNYSRGIVLYFLGIDEYAKESIFIDCFCSSVDEFDEFVTATEGPGFYIGTKDGKYALAVKNDTTITATPFKGSNVISVRHDPKYEEVEKRYIGSAYVMYDLTNADSEKAARAVEYLNSAPYVITTKELDNNIIQISAKTELAEMDILVKEQSNTAYADSIIYENDDFVLFTSTEGVELYYKK